MALDAYSLCPGGTGKKIKFCSCCNDIVGDLQKIERMVEGEQYYACLQTIDQLLAKEPERKRECLMATKGLLLRITGQLEAAKAHAIEFLEKHPTNEIALAESAILTSHENARAALAMLLGALQAANGNISARTYEAMGMVAAGLLDEGFWLPGRALLQLQVAVSDQHDEPVEMLLAFNRSPDVPLLLREDPPLLPCGDDVPWRERYIDAVQTVGLGNWDMAAAKLTSLAGEVPDSPEIWRTLSTLRAWLTDNAGASEALRKYAALVANDETHLEDAIEAEAVAMLLSDDPLGDRIDMCRIEWVVKDVDRVQEALLSTPRLKSIPFDPAQFADGETPPPKLACMILDQPMPQSCEGLSVETMPRLVGQALLFGRQTDRDARLELMGVGSDESPAIKEFFAGLLGDAIEPQSTDEVAGHWTASQKLLRPAWQPPQDIESKQLSDLIAQHLKDALLQTWPNQKLGALDGRSPKEAAADPAGRVRAAAAVMVVESWSERLSGMFDFDDLRRELGLPVFGPIDSQKHPIGSVPLVRLARVSLEGLSDDELVLAYQRAMAFAIRPAVQKFAAAIVERPTLKGRTEQLQAYGTLARSADDSDKALEYIQKGREATEAEGRPAGNWDLLELSIRFGRREGHEAVRLVEHIQAKHLEEPGVAEGLTRMLIEVGLLRPDGSPAFGPGQRPGVGGDEPAAAEPGKLWTPDSETSGGGGKLWTPE